jgi:hypothetical protein
MEVDNTLHNWRIRRLKSFKHLLERVFLTESDDSVLHRRL